jgi:hypothetical protein
MSKYTVEEIDRELARRAAEKKAKEQSSFSPLTAGKALLTGAGSMGLTASETDFPGYERFFRMGEGGAPGAAVGFGLGGPVGAVVGGLSGSIGNVAAKEIFPTNPLAQTALQMLLPGSQTAFRMRGQAVPSAQPPVIAKETGIPMTSGQTTGDLGTLLEESKVARSLRGAPIADSFKIAQAQSVDDFFSNIQRFQANPNLTPEKISSGIFSAFDSFNKKLINTFKADNAKNFNVAKKVAGNSPIIPTNNVQATIDDLIRTYDNPEVPGMASIAASLKRIKQELTTVTKSGGLIVDQRGVPLTPQKTSVTPNNISIERLQQNLAAWGDASYKGTYTGLADASPGQVKGIARRILGAFKSDLDDAAQSGVKGAQELQGARTAFSNNLTKINEIAEKPIFKYFNKASADSLVPEEVVKKFITLPPSQKAEVAAVLGNSRPDIMESLRATGLNQLLAKARVGEAAEVGAVKFNLKTALKEFGSLKDPEIQWMFPTKAEKTDFRAGLFNLQKIQKKAELFDPTSMQAQQAARALEQGTGSWAGAKAKYGTQALVSTLRFLIGTSDEQKLAAVMFNPNGKVLIRELAKDRPNINTLGKAFDNISGGLFGSSLTAKNITPERQPAQIDFSQDEVEEELRRRGLLQ